MLLALWSAYEWVQAQPDAPSYGGGFPSRRDAYRNAYKRYKAIAQIPVAQPQKVVVAKKKLQKFVEIRQDEITKPAAPEAALMLNIEEELRAKVKALEEQADEELALSLLLN